MKLVSTNVGLPRQVMWQGERVTTGIFKQPVSGRIRLGKLNLDGDGQADLAVHGGAEKAVYIYPSEHYMYWQMELPDFGLAWGAFGENFTTEGLLEEAVLIGDRFKIGTAEVMVTQPRFPCFKLGLRFGDPGMVKRFLASRRTGFYCAVLLPGEVAAGDPFELLGREGSGISVADITRLYAFEKDDVEGMQRALRSTALPEGWRSYFEKRIRQIS